jgi:hypothetical protein
VALDEVEPNVAVTTAFWSLVTAEAVPVNCALFDPEATVTEAGTVSLPLFELSATGVAEPAFAESVAVHVVVPAPVIELGEHAMPERVAGGLTVS